MTESNSINLEWRFTRTFEPGSVPDLPVEYSSVAGRMYRPTGLLVTLTARKSSINVGSISMAWLNDGVEAKPGVVTISGFIVLKNGGIGKNEYIQSLWRHNETPDWVNKIVEDLLYEVNGG